MRSTARTTPNIDLTVVSNVSTALSLLIRQLNVKVGLLAERADKVQDSQIADQLAERADEGQVLAALLTDVSQQLTFVDTRTCQREDVELTITTLRGLSQQLNVKAKLLAERADKTQEGRIADQLRERADETNVLAEMVARLSLDLLSGLPRQDVKES